MKATYRGSLIKPPLGLPLIQTQVFHQKHGTVGGNKNVEMIRIFWQLLKTDLWKKLKDFSIRISFKISLLILM
jgi:hypothetical protein